MAHFAKVVDNTVQQVIVVEPEIIESGVFGEPSDWIQTSYNTHGGVHLLEGTPLRKNFAGIGFTYDSEKDAFIAPKPFPSWILNEETCQWESPVTKPEGAKIWNEETQNWE
jgi:hypothetical protein